MVWADDGMVREESWEKFLYKMKDYGKKEVIGDFCKLTCIKLK
jgi:hypothetical protein